MNIYGWLQVILYLVVLIGLAKPLGTYMARVYEGERTFLYRLSFAGGEPHLPPWRN